MGTKENLTSDAERVQVFELTMDNPEDQDELNRQLHKPEVPNKRSAVATARQNQDDSTLESAEKKSEDRGNPS